MSFSNDDLDSCEACRKPCTGFRVQLSDGQIGRNLHGLDTFCFVQRAHEAGLASVLAKMHTHFFGFVGLSRALATQPEIVPAETMLLGGPRANNYTIYLPTGTHWFAHKASARFPPRKFGYKNGGAVKISTATTALQGGCVKTHSSGIFKWRFSIPAPTKNA